MRIAIIDDKQQDRAQLTQYVQRFSEETGISCRCTSFSDGDELLEDYDAQWELIFLDIQMARLDGMKTAERIRRLDEDVLLVFVTSMAHLAIKGYAVRAYDFLIKPINYLILKKLLSQVARRLERKDAHYVTITTMQGLFRLNAEQILYAEVKDHDLSVVTAETTYTVRSTMTKLEKELQGQPFMRCHNCYLVNLSHVQRVDKGMVTVGGHELAISRPRQKAFMAALLRFMGGNGV